MNLQTILTLTPEHASGDSPGGVFAGTGPNYPWGGLYGGQIVAQALAAASETVKPEFAVHSLHAYFIRAGDESLPVRYEVDRIRDGRSFTTRRVVALQNDTAILNMSSSYQIAEDAPDAQTVTMPDVPVPGELDNTSWTEAFDRRNFEIPGDNFGRSTAWFRATADLGDAPSTHACALSYISDDLPTEAVMRSHPDYPATFDEDNWPFWNASLDHAIWFHRPMRADEWHLHDYRSPGTINSRGLSIGKVFTAEGTHVATISQEVLLRPVR